MQTLTQNGVLWSSTLKETIRMKTPLAALAVGFTLLLGATPASAATIYDGSLNQTPAQQGWLYQGTTNPVVPSETIQSDGFILNTGNPSNYSLYYKQAPFALDRTPGYTISFRVQVNSETHKNANSAGFSLIVMSNLRGAETQPYGIQLNFWKNTIWAQEADLITPGESAAFDTSGAARSYVLKIQGNRYQLLTSNLLPPILEGTLRQYDAYTPNFIFFGDNTPSATSRVTFYRMSASPLN
jgi:hypothetical protein